MAISDHLNKPSGSSTGLPCSVGVLLANLPPSDFNSAAEAGDATRRKRVELFTHNDADRSA